VLLRDTPLNAVHTLDQRLRNRVLPEALPSLGFGLPFSAGATELQPSDDQIDMLLKRADQAMYTAKANGRAQLVLG